VLQIYQTFLEVGFALERIKAYSTKGVNSQMKFRYQVAIMMIVAIITTLPNYLVTRSIVPFGILSGTNQILYQISPSNFFQDKHWTIFLFVFALVRTLFLYIVIFILNIIAIFKYKQFIINKAKLKVMNKPNTTEEVTTQDQEKEKKVSVKKKVKKEKSITKILVVMSLNYLIGNVPNGLVTVIYQLLGPTSTVYNYFTLVALLMAILSHGSNIFLYFIYNPTYKNYLLSLFGIQTNKKNN